MIQKGSVLAAGPGWFVFFDGRAETRGLEGEEYFEPNDDEAIMAVITEFMKVA